jgi:hypothetical protein
VREISTFSNMHQDAFKVCNDFVVPETQHAAPLLLKVSGSFCICSFLPHVLATIQFNRQVLLRAAEIDDVTGYRVLSTEFHAMQLPAPQS